MTTPNIDTTGYVDLTLFDKTAQEIYEDALAYVQWVLPEWQPVETNMENVIMQAISLMVAEGQYAINRLPGATVEVLMRMQGINRITGGFPTVTVRFTTMDAAGYTIPAGTEALYDLGDGADPIVFTLDADLVIPQGMPSGVGVMTGSLATSRFNSIPAGTTFTVVTPLSYLMSVVSTSAVVGGADAESDAAFFNRGALRFSRLAETTLLPRHFEAYSIEYDTSITRAKCLDRYDPTVGPTPGDNNGCVTVAVYGDGAPISQAVKDGLLTALQASTLPSLTLNVIDPEEINMVGAHLSVTTIPSANVETVVFTLEDNLKSYLSTDSWPWSTFVRWSNVVGLIENTPGVDYIIDLEMTINRIPWDKSLFYTGIGTWANTANCTLSWDENISYGELGGSLKITPTGTSNITATSASAAGANSYPVTAGKKYWVSTRIFTPGTQTSRTTRIGVSWYTTTNTLISSQETSGVLTSAGDWVRIGEMFTAPATAVKANVYVEIDAPGSVSEFFYLDDVTLSEYQTEGADVVLVGNGPLVMPAEILVTVP